MEKIKIYLLKYNLWGITDVFLDINDTTYIQYIKEWENKYTSKHWKLEELVWEYPYWDDTLIVELVTREIEI